MTGRRITPTARQICGPRLERDDRPAWLALRREGIGGSDAAAVAGLDGWRTRWQVWLDKTGRLDDEPGEDQAEAIEFGHEMEALAARVWHRRMGGRGRLIRPGMLANVDAPWLRVNPDRLAIGVCGEGVTCVWEGKNRNAWQSRLWGADIESVPDAPAVQVQHALMVTGLGHGHLAVVVGGNQLRAYRVDADPLLQATLRTEDEWFWHDHVLAGVPPPVDATERTGRILARLWQADPDKIMVATDEVAWRVLALREGRARVAEDAEGLDGLENEVKQAMGDAEVLTDDKGNILATWKQNGTFSEKRFRAARPRVPARWQKRVRKIDTGALQAEDPDLYRDYRARVFRLPEPRGERG